MGYMRGFMTLLCGLALDVALTFVLGGRLERYPYILEAILR
jgi:hypothetical protein